MNLIPFVLQVMALAALFMAAFGLFPSKLNWAWVGMFLWLLSLMFTGSLHEAR